MLLAAEADPVHDPDGSRAIAEEAQLVYVSDARPGITRHRSGKGFSYRQPSGGLVRDKAALVRIRALAIPPAWTDVWICRAANGHIQATGRDQRGRKQYRYHARWRASRDAAKYEHMVEFAHALPGIRARVKADMAKPGLPREKVLATIVYLLEATLIRVGNDDYARQNRSFGLTTLQNRHIRVQGDALRFTFRGKGGKAWRLSMHDRRVAKVVRSCQELPGQELFQYRDANGELCDISSSDVNAYLREISRSDITAKDFRTWAGTVLAALALDEFEHVDSEAASKRNIRAAIERVASRLGNTATICRKCYVHPAVLETYLDGELALQVEARTREQLRDELASLRPEEAAVLALLLKRLHRERSSR